VIRCGLNFGWSPCQVLVTITRPVPHPQHRAIGLDESHRASISLQLRKGLIKGLRGQVRIEHSKSGEQTIAQDDLAPVFTAEVVIVGGDGLPAELGKERYSGDLVHPQRRDWRICQELSP